MFADLLKCKVFGCTSKIVQFVQLMACRSSCNAKIAKPDLIVRAKQDVGGLNIAVNQVVIMHILQSARNLLDDG